MLGPGSMHGLKAPRLAFCGRLEILQKERVYDRVEKISGQGNNSATGHPIEEEEVRIEDQGHNNKQKHIRLPHKPGSGLPSVTEAK